MMSRLAGSTHKTRASLSKLSAEELPAVLDILGIQISEAETSVSEELISELIGNRLECFKAKNFAEADRIRDELASQGIQLNDSKDSETGERVTTWEVKR